MSLKTRIQALATRIAEEINDVRDEITASQSDSNIDGGTWDSDYLPEQNIDGGTL